MNAQTNIWSCCIVWVCVCVSMSVYLCCVRRIKKPQQCSPKASGRWRKMKGGWKRAEDLRAHIPKMTTCPAAFKDQNVLLMTSLLNKGYTDSLHGVVVEHTPYFNFISLKHKILFKLFIHLFTNITFNSKLKSCFGDYLILNGFSKAHASFLPF